MNLNEAMLAVQKEIPKIAKNAQGYGYKYADLPSILSVVMPILHKYDIRLKWNNSEDNDNNLITVQPVFIRSVEGETEIEKGFSMSRPLASNTKNDLQADGSTLSYLERYTLCASLALELGDDDGASLSNENKKTAKQTTNQTAINALNNKINLYASKTNQTTNKVITAILTKYNASSFAELSDAIISQIMVELNV